MSKNWIAIRRAMIYRQETITRYGYKVILSENASWDDFHTAQKKEILAKNLGDIIEYSIKSDKEEISDFHNKLFETIAREQIAAILEQEKFAPHYYSRPENQEKYLKFINDLHQQLKE